MMKLHWTYGQRPSPDHQLVVSYNNDIVSSDVHAYQVTNKS